MQLKRKNKPRPKLACSCLRCAQRTLSKESTLCWKTPREPKKNPNSSCLFLRHRHKQKDSHKAHESALLPASDCYMEAIPARAGVNLRSTTAPLPKKAAQGYRPRQACHQNRLAPCQCLLPRGGLKTPENHGAASPRTAKTAKRTQGRQAYYAAKCTLLEI